jgi:hypothetical protein
MDHGPLVSNETDAGAELAREFGQFLPVKVAFWLKASDEEYRYLYIASERINDTNFDLAYREVVRLANRMRSPYLDPFRVKVISAEDPLAKAAVEVNERLPCPLITNFGGKSFGGISVDSVTIYPSPPSASAS